MKKKKKIHLIDVTLREGNYVIGFQLKLKDFALIVDHLDSSNIEYIEACNLGIKYPHGLTDLDYLKCARDTVKRSKIGILLTPSASSASLEDFEQIIPLIDFVRIGLNVHEVAGAECWIKKAKSKGLQVFVQLMRSPAFKATRVALAAQRAQKMGADVVYLVDTMGCMTPSDIREYVKAIQSKITIPLGFHAHNNLNLALANSLEAIAQGCTFADASLLGVGRQAGNTQLEALALLLKRDNYNLDLNIPLLMDTSEHLVAPVFKTYKGIDPYDLWSAFNKLDLYPPWIYQQMANLIGIDIKSFITEISKIKDFVSLTDEHLLNLSKRFKVPYDALCKVIQTPPYSFK